MRFVFALIALAMTAGAASADKLPWERSCSSGCIKTTDLSVSSNGHVFSAAGDEVLVSVDGARSFAPISGFTSGASIGATAAHHKSSIVLAFSTEGTPAVFYARDTGKDSSFSPLTLSLTGTPVAAAPVVAVAGGDELMAILTQDASSGAVAVHVVAFPDAGEPSVKSTFAVDMPKGQIATDISMPSPDVVHVVTAPSLSATVDSLAASRPHLASHYLALRTAFYGTPSASEALARVGKDVAGADAGLRVSSSDGGKSFQATEFELGAYTGISCAAEDVCSASVVIDSANTVIEILRPGSEWRSGYMQGSAKFSSVHFALNEPTLVASCGHSITEDGRVLATLMSSERGGLRWAPDLRESGLDTFATVRLTGNGKGGAAAAVQGGKVGVYTFSI